MEIRLGKVVLEFEVSSKCIIKILLDNGFSIENKPTVKLTEEMYIFISTYIKTKKDAGEWPIETHSNDRIYNYKDFEIRLVPDRKRNEVRYHIEKNGESLGAQTIIKDNKTTPMWEFLGSVLKLAQKMIDNDCIRFYPRSYIFYASNKDLKTEKREKRERSKSNIKNPFNEITDYNRVPFTNLNNMHERNHGFDDDTINNAFEGDPENYWNID